MRINSHGESAYQRASREFEEEVDEIAAELVDSGDCSPAEARNKAENKVKEQRRRKRAVADKSALSALMSAIEAAQKVEH